MTNSIKTIFLAHDNQESPEARRNYLEHAGYNVRLFSSAQQLIAAFRAETPACVVMDILLEGRNGFAIAEDISRAYPRRPFPLILSSRLYRSRSFREEAKRCGASAYLQVPMSLEDFLKQINHTIQTYQPPSGDLDLAA